MRKKILIVEDDPDCRELIVMQLRLDYATIEVDSGAKGLERAITEMPSLIVMDLGLPGMSGVEATRWLKEDARTKHIPIVVYTAWEEEERKKKLFQLGADRVIAKSVSPGVLKQVVQQVLATTSQTAAA